MATQDKSKTIQINLSLPTGRVSLKALPRIVGFGATMAVALVAGHAVPGIEWFDEQIVHTLVGSGIAFAASFWLREIADTRR